MVDKPKKQKSRDPVVLTTGEGPVRASQYKKIVGSSYSHDKRRFAREDREDREAARRKKKSSLPPRNR